LLLLEEMSDFACVGEGERKRHLFLCFVCAVWNGKDSREPLSGRVSDLRDDAVVAIGEYLLVT